jgi:hypothetical protein
MQRRLPGESLSELSEGKPNESLERIARQCARWSGDNTDDVAACDPHMGNLINRDADNWRPLFAIAEVIGEDWPERIRRAAAVLVQRESDSAPIMLLADLLTIFDETQSDRLSSVEACAALNAVEGKPWAEWHASKGASPKPLTPNQLARLLKGFGIIPDNIRFYSGILKGYYRHSFEDLWRRYLPANAHAQVPKDGSEPLQRYNTDEIDTSFTFQPATAAATRRYTATSEENVAACSATEEDDVAAQKCEKPAPNGLCGGVAPENVDSAPVCAHCGLPGTADELLECSVNGQRAYLHPGACQAASRQNYGRPSQLYSRIVRT